MRLRVGEADGLRVDDLVGDRNGSRFDEATDRLLVGECNAGRLLDAQPCDEAQALAGGKLRVGRASQSWGMEVPGDVAVFPTRGEGELVRSRRPQHSGGPLVLAGVDVDRVTVCGMHTEFCVDATIREAETREYRVTLVENGHATNGISGMTEEQIRDHVHRVARIVPAAELFKAGTEPA